VTEGEPLSTLAEVSVGEVPRDRDTALTALHASHYSRLCRLATLLLDEPGEAEEVVQDAFVRLYLSWRRLRDPQAAQAWLRTAVLNGSRSRLRRVITGRRVTDGLSAPAALRLSTTEERWDLMASLRQLPRRQREVLVLRYYEELSEAEIAEVLGISRGAVKSHASRALRALRISVPRGIGEREAEHGA
jgi:RNA polymerase sigma-70 factor (sigma-E family)